MEALVSSHRYHKIGDRWWRSTTGEYGDSSRLLEDYTDRVAWILENVDGAHRHAQWWLPGNYAEFLFRYERDYIRYILRWT